MAPVSVVLLIPDKIFYPGEDVNGIIEVTITKANNIKEIELKAKGYSQVSWSEGMGDDKKDYSDTEKYYKYNISVWKRVENNYLFLQVGTHRFDFHYLLPYGVPSSFDSFHGFVKHSCLAAVNVENKIFDVKCEITLSVSSLYDLNYSPLASQQILTSNEKTICCWCCKGGNLSLTLNVDHSGYVPGENIIINAECSNRSNKTTNKTIVQLIQRITHKAGASTDLENHVICSKTHPGTQPGEDDIWSGEKLIIPPLPPSELVGCSIIDVQYILKFSFSPAFPSRDLNVEAPIYIGNVPLKHLFKTFVNRAFDPPPNKMPIGFNVEDDRRCLMFDEEERGTILYANPWTAQYPDLGHPLPRRFTEDWMDNHFYGNTVPFTQENKPKRKIHQVTPLYICYRQNP